MWTFKDLIKRGDKGNALLTVNRQLSFVLLCTFHPTVWCLKIIYISNPADQVSSLLYIGIILNHLLLARRHVHDGHKKKSLWQPPTYVEEKTELQYNTIKVAVYTYIN